MPRLTQTIYAPMPILIPTAPTISTPETVRSVRHSLVEGASFDIITLYDLCEANAHLRHVSWYRQWKELKQTYKELSQSQHAAILRDYLRSKNK